MGANHPNTAWFVILEHVFASSKVSCPELFLKLSKKIPKVPSKPPEKDSILSPLLEELDQKLSP